MCLFPEFQVLQHDSDPRNSETFSEKVLFLTKMKYGWKLMDPNDHLYQDIPVMEERRVLTVAERVQRKTIEMS